MGGSTKNALHPHCNHYCIIPLTTIDCGQIVNQNVLEVTELRDARAILSLCLLISGRALLVILFATVVCRSIRQPVYLTKVAHSYCENFCIKTQFAVQKCHRECIHSGCKRACTRGKCAVRVPCRWRFVGEVPSLYWTPSTPLQHHFNTTSTPPKIWNYLESKWLKLCHYRPGACTFANQLKCTLHACAHTTENSIILLR